MNRRFRSLASLTCIIVLAGCAQTERAHITLRYELRPLSPLPPGIASLAVARIDTRCTGAAASPLDDVQWQRAIEQTLQQRLSESVRAAGLPLVVVDRSTAPGAIPAGHADAAPAPLGEEAQLLGVQGLVRGTAVIEVDESELIRAQDRQPPASRDFPSWFEGVSQSAQPPAPVACRVTLRPEFQLVAARTGQVQISTSPHSPIVRAYDESPTPAGASDSGPTRRAEIEACIDEAAADFISRFAPCTYEFTADIESSDDWRCADGVRRLRRGDGRGAQRQFDAALTANPADHRAAWGAGLAAERLGQYDIALRHYRRAADLSDEPGPAVARDRVARFLSRLPSQG